MMTSPVSIQGHGDIAVVLVDNPPVNALNAAVRQGLCDRMAQVLADPAYRAVVLACAGRTFIGGADIREFDLPNGGGGPGFVEINGFFENRVKPVVAAIHGVALGGGLEIAMACHFRIATPDATFGQPEVKLGFVPGGGATQRLPRAVGTTKAVEMIIGGEPIGTDEALRLGLIDDLFEGEPIAAGIAYARKVISERRSFSALRDDDSKLAQARENRALFTDAVAAAVKRTPYKETALACADALGWCLDMPFDEGIGRAWECFLTMKDSEQSKALRHVFFAERSINRIAGVARDTQRREIKSVAVVGAGTMGGGIAMSFANAGISVKLVEVGKEALERGLATIRTNYESTAARGGISKEEASRRIALINGDVGLEHVAGADLIIEAVFETMQIKKDVFAALDQHAKPGAILATNTSFLDVNAIAAVTKRPEDVVGMHFFSPANIMRLCEIVRGKLTAPDVLATISALARRIGKVPVVVGVSFGFVGNRMLLPRIAQARKMLLEGALPQQIDGVARKFGMMGPLAMGDLAGLDIGWRSRKDSGEISPIDDALCEAGRFGQKTGAGYYRYEPGSRAPIPDPDVEKLIVDTSRKLNITRRAFSDEEIHERLIFPMINEGVRILEDGVAERASDIDLVWIHGYAWPVQTGGPMYLAERVGLGNVAARLTQLAEADSDNSLYPVPLLQRLAEAGKNFTSFK